MRPVHLFMGAWVSERWGVGVPYNRFLLLREKKPPEQHGAAGLVARRPCERKANALLWW